MLLFERGWIGSPSRFCIFFIFDDVQAVPPLVNKIQFVFDDGPAPEAEVKVANSGVRQIVNGFPTLEPSLEAMMIAKLANRPLQKPPIALVAEAPAPGPLWKQFSSLMIII